MSEMLKLYVRGWFEFADEDTGFTTSDFGVSDNSLNERVTSRDAPAYEPEIEFVKECIEDGVYDSAAKLAHAVAEVPYVEKIDYVGDLSIGYYGVYVTATAPYGQSTKSKTEVGIGLEIIVKVKDRNGADWMVDIKTHDSSNSVDDVALLIKNAIECAIDGSEISVKYKVLY